MEGGGFGYGGGVEGFLLGVARHYGVVGAWGEVDGWVLGEETIEEGGVGGWGDEGEGECEAEPGVEYSVGGRGCLS